MDLIANFIILLKNEQENIGLREERLKP